MKNAPAVAHTAGGWPVVPLATTGANSAVSGIAAAALAGGPAGVAGAVAGAALIGGAALARRAARNRTTKTITRTAKKIPAPRMPKQSTGGSRAGRTSGPRTGTGTRAASRSGSGASGRGSLSKTRSGARPGGSSSSRSVRPSGRAGQVKALRESARTSAPTRAERRTQNTRARRQVADTRRNTSGRRSATGSGSSSGGAGRGRGGAWLGGKVRAGRDAAVQRARTARDRSAARAVDGAREKVRAAVTARQARAMKRAVRRDARRQLWRSAARKQGRRLLAALLAAPVGVLGLLTTPLGRKLGITALQYPGGRLYRHLMRTAEERQAARDAAIRERLAAAEAAIDAELSDEDRPIGDKAERPKHLVPAPSSSPVEVVNVSGFRFEEAAAEMENAARTYEPDTAMEILTMVENLPEALTSVANTFRILAERSDSEFPLEKDVAGAFDEIYGALMRAVDSSADLGPLFRQVHEHDIARHEDPRNGPEAEKGWNV
ncbi:hypothetical protein [Streptomyces sp. NRRL F-5135]|uniref:hypothetical protein n=1 Tax=Streptomyces sp. NRRL F-5135 TaxID=1463858 RepID=UPI001F1C2B65|nr:hypothetical protein [Streptomyces sp. NRRL F-5135]